MVSNPHAQTPGKLTRFALEGLEFDVPVFPQALAAQRVKATPPPHLGQHTHDVLRAAGLSEERYSQMLHAGVVREATSVGPLWAPVSAEPTKQVDTASN